MMPSGADLANSKATQGAVRGIFRGSNGIAGHADWVKVDLRQPAVAIAAVSLAAGILGTVAVMKSAPRIKSWWLDTVVPTAKNVWGTIEPASNSTDLAEPEAMLKQPILDAFTNGVEKAVQDTREPMSRADAQRNLLEIMTAASIIADRIWALSNARIEDDAELPELRAAIEKLTTQQVTDSINQIVQSDSSLLDPDTRVIFSGIFGGGQDDEGEYVPITVEAIRDALALPKFEKMLPAKSDDEDHDDKGTLIYSPPSGEPTNYARAEESGRQRMIALQDSTVLGQHWNASRLYRVVLMLHHPSQPYQLLHVSAAEFHKFPSPTRCWITAARLAEQLTNIHFCTRVRLSPFE